MHLQLSYYCSGRGTSGLEAWRQRMGTMKQDRPITRSRDHAGQKNGKVTDDRSIEIEKEEAREDAKVSPPPPYEIDFVGERKEAAVINDRFGKLKRSTRQNMDHPWIGASRTVRGKNVKYVWMWLNRQLAQKVSRPVSSLVGPRVRTYNCVIMFSIPPEEGFVS